MASCALGVALGLLIVGSVGPGSARPDGIGWDTGPTSWSNGVTLCRFNDSWPSVDVTRLASQPGGIVGALESIRESSPNGTIAVAQAATANWSSSNLSTEDRFDYAYQAVAPLSTPGGTPGSLGTADLRIDFRLPSYSGSPAGNLTDVTIELQVSNWSWQAPGDHLGAVFAFWPADTGQERLSSDVSGSSIVASVANATGDRLAYFGPSEQAAVRAPGSLTIPATANLSLTPSYARVNVEFGGVAGTYESLDYLAHIGVVVPTSAAGIPPYELFATAGGAILVTAAVAIASARIRRRPSDLEYITEEP